MLWWQRFKESYLLYSFRRDRVAMVSFGVLVFLIIVGILAPLVAPFNPYDADSIDIMNSEIPPAWMEEGETAFLFGTSISFQELGIAKSRSQIVRNVQKFQMLRFETHEVVAFHGKLDMILLGQERKEGRLHGIQVVFS